VLAVDASASVDANEFRLQIGGIADAFRDEELARAVASGPTGQIAVVLMLWAEHNRPKAFSRWALISDAASANRFADEIEGFPRRVEGSTGIGRALQAAIRALNNNSFFAERLVIDLSGDGRETAPREFTVLLPQARAIARANGVTVNGLAILSDEPDLLDYSRSEVISGAGSFAMAVDDFGGFADAIREKLLRERDYLPSIRAARDPRASQTANRWMHDFATPP